MPLKVVSNAGPLLVLAKLNILHLLEVLYGKVEFSQSVYKETVISGLKFGHPDAITLKTFFEENLWEPVIAKNISDDILSEKLDTGEMEAICLALNNNALLLIDEERGREVARKKY